MHLAQVDAYNSRGEPTLTLACGDQWRSAKMPRRRYETRAQMVTCLWCIVAVGEW